MMAMSKGAGFSKRFLGFRLAEADIRLLRIFSVVAEAGGFSAAQSELQMSMPAISRAVASLEARLATKLCTRGRRGFLLTEAGAEVLEKAGRLLGDLDRFEREMRHLHQAVTGKIRLSMVDCILGHPSRMVPRLMAALKEHAPGVDIDITIQRATEIERGLVEGRVDVGILVARQRQPGDLTRLPLYEESSNLYAASLHPMAMGAPVEELANHDYAGFSSAHGGPRTKYTHILRRTASVDHIEALAVLVASGRFIGFLPDHYVQTTPALADLVPILPDLFGAKGQIELAIKSDQPPAMAALMMDLARDLVD
jgi:DNA-binding transcriptional LysR family regulator